MIQGRVEGKDQPRQSSPVATKPFTLMGVTGVP